MLDLEERRSTSAWCPDRLTALRTLHAKGMTARQIADEMALSRNAVLAKLWREGLSRQTPAPKPRPQRDEAAKLRDKTASADIEALLASWVRPGVDVARKPLVELEAEDCKWPIGEPGTAGFGFCACRRVAGAPYCTAHLERSRATR
jgi:GcrA cell cycle regulator